MVQQIVPVPTAVAAFIGRPAAEAGPSPAPVSSLADYEAKFGQGAPDGAFGLRDAIALFYENGGGDAWVAPVQSDDLAGYVAALERIGEEQVTLLVAPHALGLPRDDYYALARAMIAQAAALRDRFAIVDIHGGGDPANATRPAALALVDDFRARIALPAAGRSYGAAYFPWLIPDAGPAQAVPPAAAIAGLYARTDANRGVWKAPAGIEAGPAGIADVAVRLTDDDQAKLNVSAADGLSVDGIRFFAGKGVLVWGARTLDGNDNEYRYVNVRRTLNFIEQSVKRALATFAPRPNSPITWAEAKGMVENFLVDLWRQGALAGMRPQDAFAVQVGLGNTMTDGDLVTGVMNVNIMVALVRPAEFMILRVQQQMPGPD